MWQEVVLVSVKVMVVMDHNNNNNHDDTYSAVIMTEVIARVHSVHLMNVVQRQAAADPQTKPPDLGCESACFRQLSSTATIAIYHKSSTGSSSSSSSINNNNNN